MEENTKTETKKVRSKRAGFGNFYFLAIVIVLYFLVWLFNPILFSSSYSTFIRMSNEILPILSVVIVLILVLNIIIPESVVVNYLGKQAGLKGWVIIIAAGIIASGPQYLWFQLLQDLKDKGMRTGYIAGFLYAKAIKIFLLPMMVYYFGWMFTIVLTAYMIIFSIIDGYLVEIFVRE